MAVSTKTLQRNLESNKELMNDMVAVFRKTDNIERLVEHLACFLDNGSFRYLFASEFSTIPLTVRFSNETSTELSNAIEGDK